VTAFVEGIAIEIVATLVLGAAGSCFLAHVSLGDHQRALSVLVYGFHASAHIGGKP
jgi:hypothetical protein